MANYSVNGPRTGLLFDMLVSTYAFSIFSRTTRTVRFKVLGYKPFLPMYLSRFDIFACTGLPGQRKSIVDLTICYTNEGVGGRGRTHV